MRKMVNVNITVPLFQRLKELEKLTAIKVTELIRRAVEEYLDKKGV